MRHKQSIGKTLLLDNIDPKIIARLADLGIDYAYSHNLTTIITSLNTFWFVVLQTTTPTSPALLNRIRPGEFTPYLQQFTLDCLSILQSTPLRSQTLMVLSFSIKVQPHPSGPVLYKTCTTTPTC